MEEKRLSKALAAAGVASRRACEELIFKGRVKVNGVVVLIPHTHVNWAKDRITVDEEPVRGEEKKLYFMLNKPAGYICSAVRPGSKKIVLDLIPDQSERLFTVGRLDKDSSGLLLITNDGIFANSVIHPSSNVVKEYLVKTVQEINDVNLKTLSAGARVDNRWVRPKLVKKVRSGTLKICIKEGKKHEVRILAERAELDIVELKRIRIGALTLGTLQEGDYRPLSERDKELLFEVAEPIKIRKGKPRHAANAGAQES
jgi:23S rRNA pseudouridine2605 synthase